MNLYLFTLGLSFGALLLMALVGLSHHAHHGAVRHGPAHGHGLRLHKAARSAKTGDTSRLGTAMWLLGLLSPRTFFSILLGFGATGLLLHPLVSGAPTLLFILAVIGGWGFEHFVVRPFWNVLFGFASTPAQTLDTLAQREEGLAATDFDAAGNGLISVNLDGQVRQVLGTLPPEERGPDATRVRTGDRLFIRTVNRRRNTCTVSRVGTAC